MRGKMTYLLVGKLLDLGSTNLGIYIYIYIHTHTVFISLYIYKYVNTVNYIHYTVDGRNPKQPPGMYFFYPITNNGICTINLNR